MPTATQGSRLVGPNRFVKPSPPPSSASSETIARYLQEWFSYLNRSCFLERDAGACSALQVQRVPLAENPPRVISQSEIAQFLKDRPWLPPRGHANWHRDEGFIALGMATGTTTPSVRPCPHMPCLDGAWKNGGLGPLSPAQGEYSTWKQQFESYVVRHSAPVSRMKEQGCWMHYVYRYSLAEYSRFVLHGNNISSAAPLHATQLQAGLWMTLPRYLGTVPPTNYWISGEEDPKSGLPDNVLNHIRTGIRYIVIPVDWPTHCHWSLVIVDMHSSTAIIWDSGDDTQVKPDRFFRVQLVRVRVVLLLTKSGLPSPLYWREGEGIITTAACTSGYHCLEAARAFLNERGLLNYAKSQLRIPLHHFHTLELEMVNSWMNWAARGCNMMKWEGDNREGCNLPCCLGGNSGVISDGGRTRPIVIPDDNDDDIIMG